MTLLQIMALSGADKKDGRKNPGKPSAKPKKEVVISPAAKKQSTSADDATQKAHEMSQQAAQLHQQAAQEHMKAAGLHEKDNEGPTPRSVIHRNRAVQHVEEARTIMRGSMPRMVS